MKSIDLKTWEVQALLVGRKTAALRAMKPQPESAYRVFDRHEDTRTFEFLRGKRLGGVLCEHITNYKAPYWPGDILCVRETFFEYRGRFYYKADGMHEALAKLGIHFKWSPSIHMPREAARIFLRVKDVRVEKLRHMGLDDFEDEGLSTITGLYDTTARFADLWDATLKPADRALYSWEADPWVWVIEFERIRKEEANEQTDH